MDIYTDFEESYFASEVEGEEDILTKIDLPVYDQENKTLHRFGSEWNFFFDLVTDQNLYYADLYALQNLKLFTEIDKAKVRFDEREHFYTYRTEGWGWRHYAHGTDLVEGQDQIIWDE